MCVQPVCNHIANLNLVLDMFSDNDDIIIIFEDFSELIIRIEYSIGTVLQLNNAKSYRMSSIPTSNYLRLKPSHMTRSCNTCTRW